MIILVHVKWSWNQNNHGICISQNIGKQKTYLNEAQPPLLVQLTIGRTSKFIPSLYPHRDTRGVGVDGTPPQSFWYIALSISKRICLQWKAFDFLKKIRYMLWVVALLEAFDVTNNDRHLWSHLSVIHLLNNWSLVSYFQ